MENGINLEVVWFDQGVNEVAVCCSNGEFSGRAEVYLSRGAVLHVAEILRGFPSRIGDHRRVELGTFDPSYAGGGVEMSLSCGDSSGRAIIGIRLQSDARNEAVWRQSVALRIPIEPAAIDSFVQELVNLERGVNAKAHLPMAI